MRVGPGERRYVAVVALTATVGFLGLGLGAPGLPEPVQAVGAMFVPVAMLVILLSVLLTLPVSVLGFIVLWGAMAGTVLPDSVPVTILVCIGWTVLEACLNVALFRLLRCGIQAVLRTAQSVRAVRAASAP